MRSVSDLAVLISRQLPEQGMAATALPRLSLFRADAPTLPLPTVYEASVCLIAQGAKRVALGPEVVAFDAAHHLVVSVDLPLVGHVTEASSDRPYLCCKIDFDLRALADLVVQTSNAGQGRKPEPMLTSYPSDPELIDAACRLVTLLDRPSEAALLVPLVERARFCAASCSGRTEAQCAGWLQRTATWRGSRAPSRTFAGIWLRPCASTSSQRWR